MVDDSTTTRPDLTRELETAAAVAAVAAVDAAWAASRTHDEFVVALRALTANEHPNSPIWNVYDRWAQISVSNNGGSK